MLGLCCDYFSYTQKFALHLGFSMRFRNSGIGESNGSGKQGTGKIAQLDGRACGDMSLRPDFQD